MGGFHYDQDVRLRQIFGSTLCGRAAITWLPTVDLTESLQAKLDKRSSRADA